MQRFKYKRLMRSFQPGTLSIPVLSGSNAVAGKTAAAADATIFVDTNNADSRSSISKPTIDTAAATNANGTSTITLPAAAPSREEEKKKKKKKKNAANDTTDCLRQDLRRWDAIDAIVAEYDAQISPVLGGGANARAEQKRLRHLEAWLWARRFHPLVPLGGPPSATAAAAADGALVTKLLNAGLAEAEAVRRVAGLTALLQSPSTAVGSSDDRTDRVEVTVSRGATSDTVSLSCGQRTLSLRAEYFERLRHDFAPPPPSTALGEGALGEGGAHDDEEEDHREAATAAREAAFASACFRMLARYRTLQVHERGGGNQGAVPPAVWTALKEWAATHLGRHCRVLEAFASPLNRLAGAGAYHSAFPDVDVCFGSRGSFFDVTCLQAAAADPTTRSAKAAKAAAKADAKADAKAAAKAADEAAAKADDAAPTVVEVNPPFDEELVARTAEALDHHMHAAARAKRPLVAVVIVPQTDWPGHAALCKSRFVKWTRTLPAAQHVYVVGNQHTNAAARYYPASRATTLVLLASQSVAGASALGPRLEAAFKEKPPA